MYDLESTRALVREEVPDYHPSDEWLLSVAKLLNIMEEIKQAGALKLRES
jgi:hypothetical protein